MAGVNVYRLGEIAEIYTGYVPSRAETTRTRDARPFGFIQVRDIQDGVLSWTPEPVDVTEPRKARRSQVEPNDVLLSSRGTQVKAAVVPKGYPEALISSNLLGVRPQPIAGASPIRSAVLAAYFSTKAGEDAIVALSTQTTMRLAVTAGALEKLEVLVPDAETQFRIEQLVNATNQYVRTSREAAELRQRVVNATLETHLDPMKRRLAP